MSEARLFVPQEALENWVSEGRAELEEDSMTFEGQRFHITSAVRFLAEVTGGGDELNLAGRVKSRAQLDALSAEQTGSSVVIGDEAYEVVEGYLLRPALASGDRQGDIYPRLLALFAHS